MTDEQRQPGRGWYRDPGSTGRFRYWTGSEWSKHVHDGRRFVRRDVEVPAQPFGAPLNEESLPRIAGPAWPLWLGATLAAVVGPAIVVGPGIDRAVISEFWIAVGLVIAGAGATLAAIGAAGRR